MKHHCRDALEIVLCLLEEIAVYIVGLCAQRQSRMQPVVQSNARLDRQGAFTVPGRLRLQMSPADQYVAPGFESRSTRTDVDTTTAAKVLHMRPVIDGGSKPGRQIAFQAKPVVCKISDGGIQSNHAGIEDIGPEDQEFHTQG
jgi:hypothetical protein